jgi:hypothetical protein
VTRLDRMKHGSGIKGRDDRSSGIEIRISDTLAKINPTDPLILAKQAARRNLNCSDSSGTAGCKKRVTPEFSTFHFFHFSLYQDGTKWVCTARDVPGTKTSGRNGKMCESQR